MSDLPDFDAIARALVAEANQRIRHMHRRLDDDEEARIRCDIEAGRTAEKKTRLFRGGMSWRYWSGGKDGRGREVRFCYTVRRNVAGYFLGFREVRKADGSGFRDGWFAHKRRATVRDRARALAEKQRKRKAPPPAC